MHESSVQRQDTKSPRCHAAVTIWTWCRRRSINVQSGGGGGFGGDGAGGECDADAGAGSGGAADAAEVVQEYFAQRVSDEEDDGDAGGHLDREMGLRADGEGPTGDELGHGDVEEFPVGVLHHDEFALSVDVAEEEDGGDGDHGEESAGDGEDGGEIEAVHEGEGAEAGGDTASGGDEELGARGGLGEGVVVEAGEVFEVAELFAHGELGFAVDTVAEGDGDFGDAVGGDVCFDEKFEGDFVANGVEGVGVAEAVAAHGEEAGHGVFDGADEGFGEEGSAGGIKPAEAGPVFGAAAVAVAGADDEIGFVALELFDHGGDGVGGVAEVGVHDDDIFVVGQGHAGEDSGGEAAFADADFVSELGVSQGEVVQDFAGAVVGVVVDDDDFP